MRTTYARLQRHGVEASPPPAKAKPDTHAIPTPKCVFRSSMHLEREALARGLSTLVNARVFAERLLHAPPTVGDGYRLHPRAIGVGRGWIIVSDLEWLALTGTDAPKPPDVAAQRARANELARERRANRTPEQIEADLIAEREYREKRKAQRNRPDRQPEENNKISR